MTATAQQLEFLKDSIKSIQDYPKPGILFRDVTSLLEDPKAYALSIELLTELLTLVEQRPDISTGALLEHFDGREEQDALHKLAAQTLPGDEAMWTQELHDAVAQLEKQLLMQRLDELQAKQSQQGLDDTDKYELRELLKARSTLRF